MQWRFKRPSVLTWLAVVGYIGLLFYFDWRLALVFLTAAPLVVYPLVRLGQRVRRTTRRSQEDLEHDTSHETPRQVLARVGRGR